MPDNPARLPRRMSYHGGSSGGAVASQVRAVYTRHAYCSAPLLGRSSQSSCSSLPLPFAFFLPLLLLFFLLHLLLLVFRLSSSPFSSSSRSWMFRSARGDLFAIRNSGDLKNRQLRVCCGDPRMFRAVKNARVVNLSRRPNPERNHGDNFC